MGVVLKVKRLENDNVIALKYCKESNEDLLKRFAREARIMQGIKHKHVVRVLGINLQHDPPYFLMPLAAHSIDAEIDHLKNNEGEAIEAFHQMCLGVSAIH